MKHEKYKQLSQEQDRKVIQGFIHQDMEFALFSFFSLTSRSSLSTSVLPYFVLLNLYAHWQSAKISPVMCAAVFVCICVSERLQSHRRPSCSVLNRCSYLIFWGRWQFISILGSSTYPLPPCTDNDVKTRVCVSAEPLQQKMSWLILYLHFFCFFSYLFLVKEQNLLPSPDSTEVSPQIQLYTSHTHSLDNVSMQIFAF